MLDDTREYDSNGLIDRATALKEAMQALQGDLLAAGQVPGAPSRYRELAGWVERLAKNDLTRISHALTELATGQSAPTAEASAAQSGGAAALPALHEGQECIKIGTPIQNNQILNALRYVGAQNAVHYLKKTDTDGRAFFVLPKALAEHGMLKPLTRDASGQLTGEAYSLTAEDLAASARMAAGNASNISR